MSRILKEFTPAVLSAALAISACSPLSNRDSGKIINETQPSAGLTAPPEYLKLQPYYIDLPARVKEDLAKVIWFTLKSGGAKNINRDDFYHCHTLIYKDYLDSQFGPSLYHGTLSDWIDGVVAQSEGLLCHAQEFILSGPDQQKRNTAIWAGGAPYTVPLSWLDDKTVQHQIYTALPHNISEDLVYGVQLHFDIDPHGSLSLPNGDKLKIAVEHPESYFIYKKNWENLIIDLP